MFAQVHCINKTDTRCKLIDIQIKQMTRVSGKVLSACCWCLVGFLLNFFLFSSFYSSTEKDKNQLHCADIFFLIFCENLSHQQSSWFVDGHYRAQREEHFFYLFLLPPMPEKSQTVCPSYEWNPLKLYCSTFLMWNCYSCRL